MKLLPAVILSLLAGQVLAAPGDILYIHGDDVNMRKAPSTSSDIVLKLSKGHKLVEFQREGAWVEVGADRTEGKSGWVSSSLVGKEFLGGSTKAPANPVFDKFQSAFNKLNAQLEKQTGITLFTKAENLGDGIIQITATNTWLSSKQSDKERNLLAIFQLWNEIEASGLPIAVYIVDKSDVRQMTMKR